MAPNLFIGMPVFNGERFIRDALDSLVAQTYTNWKLVVSDNASTDDTPRICQSYASNDPRIHYVRQATNLGAMPNFKFLLEQADCPYFMWAAADDIWNESFVEACITGLESGDEIGWAFTNMVNIDSYGRTVRHCPSFAKFLNGDRCAAVAGFVLDPEYLGKANLIYGVYKLARLRGFMMDFLGRPEMSAPAADIAFNIGVMCRTSLFIDERVLFGKRYVRPTDVKESVSYIKPSEPYIRGMIKPKEFPAFKQAALLASDGTAHADLVSALFQYRESLSSDIETLLVTDPRSLIYAIGRWVSRKLGRVRSKMKRILLRQYHTCG